jgi:MinD-like ATPase involved in chromosome partitioning or flagellar assembly
LGRARPDLILVELDPFDDALLLIVNIRKIHPKLPVLGFARQLTERELRVAQAEEVEVLSLPPSQDEFLDAVERASGAAESDKMPKVIAFASAKGGCGATTIGLNVAGYLANDLGQKVLVVEADVYSGILSFMLNIQSQRFLLDALSNPNSLKENWRRTVVTSHGIDFLLGSAPESLPAVPSWKYSQLLRFLGSRYDAIIVDLRDTLGAVSSELTRRAGQVFIVTTADLFCLALVRRRQSEMRKLGQQPRVLVNRWSQQYGGIEISEIEQLVDGPLAGVFEEDQRAMQRAIHGMELVEKDSRLGKAMHEFSRQFAGAGAAEPVRPGKSFSRFAGQLVSKIIPG